MRVQRQPLAVHARSPLLIRTFSAPRSRRASRLKRPAECVVRQAACTSAALDVSSSVHRLPDGTELELLRQGPSVMEVPPDQVEGNHRGRPPLLFLHGSGHAAWCWQERFMPFFAERGYDCHAISFRGQGKGTVADGSPPGTLASNAADAASYIDVLPVGPVVVGHSFGGLVLQKYLERMGGAGWPRLAGAAFLAAAPPSGNSELVKRMIRKLPIKSLKITYGFIRKTYQGNAGMAKEMFFSDDIPDEDLQRYTEQFKAHPGKGRLLDLKRLSDEIPIEFPSELPPCWVGGATDDCIVDDVACQELAEELGVKAVTYSDMAHDMMLDTRWQAVATDLEQWIAQL